MGSKIIKILIGLAVILVLFLGFAVFMKHKEDSEIGSITYGVGPKKSGKTYASVTDKWNDKEVYEGQAAEDAIKALLEAADAGDKDLFAQQFISDIRRKSSFDDKLDEFFANYPVGLSSQDLKYRPAGGGGSYRGKDIRKSAGATYECVMNGEWYRINIGFCFVNTADPDNVGVMFCTVVNLGGAAEQNDIANQYENYLETIYLECVIRSPEEHPARMIAGNALSWKDTPNKKISRNEMKSLLERNENLDDNEVKDTIGEANVSIKASNSSGYRYYYELEPASDGTPQYASITTSGEYGRIIDGYVCDENDTDYDNPLVNK
jgi:hypothetical protein